MTARRLYVFEMVIRARDRDKLPGPQHLRDIVESAMRDWEEKYPAKDGKDDPFTVEAESVDFVKMRDMGRDVR